MKSRWRKEEEVFQDLGWIEKYLVIKEIDDVEFRRAIFFGLTQQDAKRRFEIHNTDLIYCLIASFAHKILGKEFSEGEYYKIFHWLRGKGIELGVVNALAQVLSAYSIEKDNIFKQKIVNIGESQGSVDLEIFGMPYEITTRLFYSPKRKLPPVDKILQNLSYQAADKKKVGRVKVYIMVPKTERVPVESPIPNVNMTKGIRRTERTWEIALTDEGLLFFIQVFTQRSSQLGYALRTGKWRGLPKAYFPWRCRGCGTCEYLKTHPKEVAIAWLKWRKGKMEFDGKNEVREMLIS